MIKNKSLGKGLGEKSEKGREAKKAEGMTPCRAGENNETGFTNIQVHEKKQKQ